MLELVWLIPALPLAGFLLLAASSAGASASRWPAGSPRSMVGGSFVVDAWSCSSACSTSRRSERQFTQTLFSGSPPAGFSVDVGFLVDPLSITMVLFITGVGTLIHLYSIGYMHGDPKFSKFFVYLNLFVFSMLMLVLGDNLLLTFLGWEGVGRLLVLPDLVLVHETTANAVGRQEGVRHQPRSVTGASWSPCSSTFIALGSHQLRRHARPAPAGWPRPPPPPSPLLLFVGAVGKSAQLPLYVWLPDAMAGPTPVSALIHAATMVTAGVYLMTRVNPVLAAAYAVGAARSSPWIGALTALFAATIAVAQNDIKKVLAYSTVSQLGYMFLAVGSGAYVAAIFHMITHAFFKALLFLGAGSVIHGMHDEQDMRRMGGLRKCMPITAVTFIVGWLAIAGVPPFAGFWSKDEILAVRLRQEPGRCGSSASSPRCSPPST